MTALRPGKGEAVIDVGNHRVIAEQVRGVEPSEQRDRARFEVESRSLRSGACRVEYAPQAAIAPGRRASRPGRDDPVARKEPKVTADIPGRSAGVAVGPEAPSRHLGG